jgi:peptide/nickel transport system substrate-binding protein
MTMKKMRARAVAVGVLAALVVSGAAGTGAAARQVEGPRAGGQPVPGGNLVIDIDTPQQNFDVNQTSDNESIWAYDQVAQTLYINGPDGKTLEPCLATSYSLSADKLSWTFQLRHGVRFSTGAPMTSKDVAFSIDQALNPNSVWSFIDGSIKSVSATGPYTVVVTTKHPWAPLLADLALFANAVVPYGFGGQSRAQFFQHPVGTGPFELSAWVKGEYLKLTKNPYYWEPGKPYLDSVTYQAVADAPTRVLQLEGGKAQVIESAPFALLSSIKAAGYDIGLFPSTRIDYVTMNELYKPLADVHVRRAISYAIDTKAVMQAIFFGYGEAADSPLMPSVNFYSPASAVLSYNLARAKAELAKSAYPHGGFSIDFITGSGDPIQTGVAQIVQDELSKLNIQVKIRLLDPSQVTDQEQSFHFGMRETYWTMDIVDPDEWVSFGFDGRAGSYSNFTHYNSPEVDKLVTEAEETFSSSARAALYGQIDNLVASQAPMVWLGYSPYSYAYSPGVHGFFVYPEGNAHLEDVWLSR